MKKYVVVCLAFLHVSVAFTPVWAQQNIYIKKKYFTMPPDAGSDDYYHGMIQVRLKPEFRSLFSGKLRSADKRIKMLDPMQITDVRRAVPKGIPDFSDARLEKPFKFDPGLYQVIYFNDNFPVEEAVNLLYNAGIADIAEPIYTVRNYFVPDDSLLSNQFYLDIVKAFKGWNITTGDSSVVIGIPDTAVDIDHPDLAGNLFINVNDPVDGIDNDQNGYIDDWRGWDFAGASANNPFDEDNDPSIPKGNDFSHGTGVGGVAGAVGNNSRGISGIAQHCKLLFTKHYADNQPDTATTYATPPFTGLLYCAMMGADIINCSWGGPYPSQIYQDYIDMVTEDMGILIVASSGNSYKEEESYPASYRNVLSVGSIDSNFKISDFSTSNTNVDLMAPGRNIFMTQYNNGYASNSGTSFSSPMVAGAAALVKSLYPGFTGLQIGELLRVTSNDTLYEVNNDSKYKYKNGHGVMDIESALTNHPPGIRLKSYSLVNSEGQMPKPGDDATLTGEFINYLWPSSGNLAVTLKSQSSLMTVTGNSSELGIIGTLQATTNTSRPFKVTLQNDIPENTTINLLFEFTDGSYYDYQFVSILLNPTFINITQNNIASSMTENGRIGYQDTNQAQGLGVVLDGNEMLFEMGLMLGTSGTEISNCVRTDNSAYDNDFVPVQPIYEISPGVTSESEIYGSFNDDNAGNSKSDVLVRYRTMVWKGDPDNNYFIVRYSIQNTGSDTLRNFYAGLYADWDVSDMGANDRAAWDSLYRIGYVFSTDTTKQLYGGIQVLSGQPGYRAIENDNSLAGNPWGVYDGFTDQEKFQSLSGGTDLSTAGFELEGGTDVSHTVASGPYIINPGDSVSLAFAIHAAKTLPALLASAAAADTMYNFTLNTPAPVASNDTICWDSNTLLIASNGTSFNWFNSKSGGTPFYTGDSLALEHVKNDTVYFVSNADSAWQSVRTPVYLVVKARPDVIVSGSTVLCPGDTVTLIGGNADRYLWNPGGQMTQNIKVADSGIFQLTVYDDKLNCVSQSPVVAVTRNPAPVASFSSDIDQVIQNKPTLITLTDLSDNAVSWQWKISDGQNSTLEDPQFTLTTASELTITLTIMSAEGCVDSVNQVISITGLENPLTSDNVFVYPNPVNRIINLKYPKPLEVRSPIYLCDPEGRVVKILTVPSGPHGQCLRFYIGDLLPGLYIIKMITNDQGNIISRIIKN